MKLGCATKKTRHVSYNDLLSRARRKCGADAMCGNMFEYIAAQEKIYCVCYMPSPRVGNRIAAWSFSQHRVDLSGEKLRHNPQQCDSFPCTTTTTTTSISATDKLHYIKINTKWVDGKIEKCRSETKGNILRLHVLLYTIYHLYVRALFGELNRIRTTRVRRKRQRLTLSP